MEVAKKPITAEEVLASLARQNPGRKFAKSKEDGVVGVWSDEAGRYIRTVCKTILPGQPWVLMDREVKVNGELPKIDWIPYEPPAAA